MEVSACRRVLLVSFINCLVVALFLLGCAVHDKGNRIRYAADARGNPFSVHCSYTADAWRERCNGAPKKLLGLCRELSCTDRPETIALALNVAASDLGVLPSGFGELRFLSGVRGRFTLREWIREQAKGGGRNEAELLEALAFDANRNFGSDCRADRGALAEDIELPLCYARDVFVRGARGAVCSVLTTPCGRGILDEERTCCDIVPRAEGIPCGGGGRCSGSGVCVPPTKAGDVEPPVVHRGITGTEHWIDVPSADSAASFRYIKDGISISLDDVRIVDLYTQDLVLSDVHVSYSAGSEGTPFVSVVAPVQMRSLYVPRLLAKEDPEICVVAARYPELGTVLSDCSSPNTIRLSCPGETSGILCEALGNAFKVTGIDVIIAWEKMDGEPRDIHPLWLPGVCPPEICGGLGGTAGCSPPCRNFAGGCINACGELSLRTCDLLTGCPGPCMTPREVCGDGVDNDCDGVMDDDACDDRLSCTVDRCIPTIYRWTGIPDETEVRYVCDHRVADWCRDGAQCTLETCSISEPEVGHGQEALRHDDYNFCWEIRDHDWCTNTWDSCDCNGRELCDPHLDGADAASGCVPRDPPPCNTDDDLCTVELCCEENPGCRTGTTPQIHAGPVTKDCKDLRGRRLPWAPGDSTTVYCVDRYEETFLGESWKTYGIITCNDGNQCTRDACNPETGTCESRVIRGNACEGPDGRRNTADGCGVFECAWSGDARCIRSENRSAHHVSCPEQDVPGSYTRCGFSEVGEPITYRLDDWEGWCRGLIFKSCHEGACRNSGLRGVCGITTTGECPPDQGCITFHCTGDTTVKGGGIIGCQRELHSDRCSSLLPPSNRCLRATCTGDPNDHNGGVPGCQFIPEDSLCGPSTERCSDGTPPRMICQPGTGECKADCGPF